MGLSPLCMAGERATTAFAMDISCLVASPRPPSLQFPPTAQQNRDGSDVVGVCARTEMQKRLLVLSSPSLSAPGPRLCPSCRLSLFSSLPSSTARLSCCSRVAYSQPALVLPAPFWCPPGRRRCLWEWTTCKHHHKDGHKRGVCEWKQVQPAPVLTHASLLSAGLCVCPRAGTRDIGVHRRRVRPAAVLFSESFTMGAASFGLRMTCFGSRWDLVGSESLELWPLEVYVICTWFNEHCLQRRTVWATSSCFDSGSLSRRLSCLVATWW